MLEDQNGVLWLSSNGAGLLKFDREHRRFIRYRNNLADPESLAQNSVREVFADQEGIIWASLGGFGLTRFTSKPLPFQDIATILAIRPAGMNLSLGRFTRTIRGSCGSVPTKRLIESTAKQSDTMPLASPPQEREAMSSLFVRIAQGTSGGDV